MEVSGRLITEKENDTELCEPCTVENVSNLADGFCKDCDEFMCQNCFGYHLKGKHSRNHVLDPISGAQIQRKLRTKEEKCKAHASEAVKYYCSFHDFVGCGDCIVSNHRKCEPEFIRDLALNLEESSEFKSLKSQLQNSDAEKAESETRIARYRKENNMLVGKALRKIREFRRDIDCWLDKMETNIEAEVGTISDANETTFSELQQMIVEVSEDIDRTNQLLNSNIQHVENLFIRMIECKPEVGDIDKTLSKIKSKLVFERYTFEQGEDMKELLKSLDKFGSIKVITKTENEQRNEQSREDVNRPPLAEGSCITTESEPKDVWAGAMMSDVKEFWYPLRAELEEELENIKQKANLEKEEKVSMQQAYNKLKTGLEKELENTRQMAVIEKKEKESLEQAYNKLKTELEKELEKTKQMAVTEKAEKVSLQQAYNKLKTELQKELEETKQMAVTEKKEKESLQQAYNKLKTELEKELEKTKQMAVTEKGEKVSLQQAYNKLKTELEKELEKTRQMAVTEKGEKVSLQQAYNKLKKELEAQEALLTRERENSVVVTTERDQKIDLMKQEVSSLNDLNTSLKSQLYSRNKEFDVLESTYKARQEQDNNTIKSLQSELSKISENHEKECKRLSGQILDLQHQMETAVKTYQIPDPRAAGFDVGKRVESTGPIMKTRTGTVTAVDPSGYVGVKWDNGRFDRCRAGAGGMSWVKLL